MHEHSGFYSLGWVSGTGGSISIKVTKTDTGGGDEPDVIGSARESEIRSARIVMAPSGVMKERMKPDDIFVLDGFGHVVKEPVTNAKRALAASSTLSSLSNLHKVKPLCCSECAPLFLSAYHMRNAGAIIHSHALSAVAATLLYHEGDTDGTRSAPRSEGGHDEFRITEVEMIKGIKGHGFYDTLVVPIIENTAREYELTESLQKAIAAYPKSNAVLVRRHGVYIWGDDWAHAKTQAECYHYLFEAAVEMKKMGIDPRLPRVRKSTRALTDTAAAMYTNGHSKDFGGAISDNWTTKRRRVDEDGGAPLPKVVILDIEGTTTPLAFVQEVLFPYARQNLEAFLKKTWETQATKDWVERLASQLVADAGSGQINSVSALSDDGDQDAKIRDCVAVLLGWMDADRKVSVLKELQGRIWEGGYEDGTLQGEVYEDVPKALSSWTGELGIRVYIYSSGSVAAQKLLFANTAWGDLTKFLSGHFDTTTGGKRESASYTKILSEIDVAGEDTLFVTDIHEEAKAAQEAGMAVAVSVRPGNYALPKKHGWSLVPSFGTVLETYSKST